MPAPKQFARGDRMGRGPYEKSGLIEESGLHPGKTKKEHLSGNAPAVAAIPTS